MFKIPSKVLSSLYHPEFPTDVPVVCTTRYSYSLYENAFHVDDLTFDIVQRVSLSNPNDISQCLVQSWPGYY